MQQGTKEISGDKKRLAQVNKHELTPVMELNKCT